MHQLTPENFQQISAEQGVYHIWAKDVNGNFIHINRFCDTDTSGLLYIGRTTGQTLPVRLYQFWASSNILMRTYNHSGGLKYKKFEIIRNTLGAGHQLWFTYQVCQDPVQEEALLISNYILQYGECPPLNR